MIEAFESLQDGHLAEFEESLCKECEMYTALTIIYGTCDHCGREGVKVYENKSEDKWWCVDWHKCCMVEVETEKRIKELEVTHV